MARTSLETARRRGVQVVLPVDAVVADGLDSPSGRAVSIREIPDHQMGLDIGPLTVDRFAATLKTAKTIVWNGPMGVFEKPPFAQGTVASNQALSLYQIRGQRFHNRLVRNRFSQSRAE